MIMMLKRLVVVAGLPLALGFLTPALVADTSDEAQEEQEESTADAEPEEKKPGFWGNRFALYVETMAGTASGDDFGTSVETGAQISVNSVTFDEQDNTRFAIGWTLPEGRGAFRLVFTGLKETEYSFDASGRRLTVVDPTTIPTSFNSAAEAVEWWSVQIRNGQLVSQAQEPTWVPSMDDANNNGVPDLNEIRFLPSNLGSTRSIADSLQNQIQTLDLFYQRDFGGRQVNARWGAGLRYFTYEGNVPVAAWLSTIFVADPTEVYTEGSNLRLINFAQETTAIGPSGYAELHLNFLRERIVLYWLVRAAFVLQDLETDSGTFFTYVRNISTLSWFPAEARLTESRSKDVWQTGGEAGARFRLVNGLTLHLAYFLTSYQDSVLLPTLFGIPENLQQASDGTAALYSTRDIRLDGWRAGFSYQF